MKLFRLLNFSLLQYVSGRAHLFLQDSLFIFGAADQTQGLATPPAMCKIILFIYFYFGGIKPRGRHIPRHVQGNFNQKDVLQPYIALNY